jgi:hypothetical protein
MYGRHADVIAHMDKPHFRRSWTSSGVVQVKGQALGAKIDRRWRPHAEVIPTRARGVQASRVLDPRLRGNDALQRIYD